MTKWFEVVMDNDIVTINMDKISYVMCNEIKKSVMISFEDKVSLTWLWDKMPEQYELFKREWRMIRLA